MVTPTTVGCCETGGAGRPSIAIGQLPPRHREHTTRQTRRLDAGQRPNALQDLSEELRLLLRHHIRLRQDQAPR